MEASRDPLVVLDEALHVRMNSRAFEVLVGGRKVVPGSSLLELAGGAFDAPELLTRLREAIAHRRPFDGVALERQLPSGPRLLVCHGRVVRDGAGEGLRILLLLEDRTEAASQERERQRCLAALDEANARAEELGKHRERLVRTLAHELRGPLSVVMQWAQMIDDGMITEGEKLRRASSAIVRSVVRQRRIVEDLVDLSSIESSSLVLKKGPVDCRAILDQVVAELRPTAESKAVTLELSGDGPATMEMGDADRLKQVQGNLIGNAIKFTPRGGRVDVWLGNAGSRQVLRVRDTGIGIPEQRLAGIVEPFRAGRGDGERGPGLGVGLAIARRLVELHGGTLTVESEGEGKGTTVTVSLPVATSEEAAEPAKVAPGDVAVRSAAGPSLEGLRGRLAGLSLLVVDDEADAREAIATVLASCGAEVVAAESVRRALELIRERQPDVVVCDVGMPEQDGFAFVRELRKLDREEGGRIPVIALTGFDTHVDRRLILASDFHAHLGKPVEARRLVETVGDAKLPAATDDQDL